MEEDDYLGKIKYLREGISEIKIEMGAGYRVYVNVFVKDSKIYVLNGGDKSTQNKDIEKAITLLMKLERSKKMSEEKVIVTKEDAKLTKFDIADYIKTDEDIEIYLNSILEDEDCTDKDIQRALNNIARIKGMTKIAKDINVNREGLYRTLSGKIDANFSTIYKLIKNLGLTLRVEKAAN